MQSDFFPTCEFYGHLEEGNVLYIQNNHRSFCSNPNFVRGATYHIEDTLNALTDLYTLLAYVCLNHICS